MEWGFFSHQDLPRALGQEQALLWGRALSPHGSDHPLSQVSPSSAPGESQPSRAFPNLGIPGAGAQHWSVNDILTWCESLWKSLFSMDVRDVQLRVGSSCWILARFHFSQGMGMAQWEFWAEPSGGHDPFQRTAEMWVWVSLIRNDVFNLLTKHL